MTTIKFDKSVKYRGIRYAAHEAFKVEDEDVAKLKKEGAIVLSTEAPTPPPSAPDTEPPVVEDEDEGEEETGGEGAVEDEDVAKLKEALLDYTVPELTAFAQEKDIDLQGKTRKADIYNIIIAALG